MTKHQFAMSAQSIIIKDHVITAISTQNFNYQCPAANFNRQNKISVVNLLDVIVPENSRALPKLSVLLDSLSTELICFLTMKNFTFSLKNSFQKIAFIF